MARPAKAAAKAPTLTPLQLHAIAQVAKDSKKCRDELVQGKGQLVDVTVRIVGAVDVGADHTAEVTETLEAAVVIGLMLDRLPVRTRGQIVAALDEACAEWTDGGEEPEVSKEASESTAALLTSVKRKVGQARRGPVTASLSLTLVDQRQQQAA